VDGERHGFTLGRYEDEAAASYVANVYARIDMLERPKRSAALFARPLSIQ
jgi:hypothetical protein